MRIRKRTVPRLALPAFVASMTALDPSIASAQDVPPGSGFDAPLPPEEPKPPGPEELTAPPPEAYGIPADPLIDVKSRRSWNEGPARPFLATTLDVGWTYLRPRASLGWGKPFVAWFGIDANPIIQGTGLGAYGGLRLALPRFDLRVGPRYFFGFNRNYLNPQRS